MAGLSRIAQRSCRRRNRTLATGHFPKPIDNELVLDIDLLALNPENALNA